MESQSTSKKMAKRFDKPGRPKAKIDWNKVDQLIMGGSNGVQVAAELGIYPDTLYRACEREQNATFAAYFQEKRAKGDSYLHQGQYRKAVKDGNSTMLIWLGKQRLGQKDTQEEAQITPETIAHYKAVLDQMEKLQQLSARKSEETRSNTETKS